MALTCAQPGLIQTLPTPKNSEIIKTDGLVTLCANRTGLLDEFIGYSRVMSGTSRTKKDYSDYKLNDSYESLLDRGTTKSNSDHAMEVKSFTKSDLSSLQSGSELLKRILIVDDDRDIVFTLKSILEGYYTRFEVFSYADPIEALSTFKAQFYDLALIDINMPLMNGFQLCEKLIELDANVRVCFMSGGEMNQDAVREIYPKISLGCFIRKPVGANDLIEKIIPELD